ALKAVEYNYSDVGWYTYRRYYVDNSLLPVSFNKIRITVEPRTFPQIATHRGSCRIPAGQTSCIINDAFTMQRGTTGYIHDQVEIRSEDGKLVASASYAEVNWNDELYPSLKYNYAQNLKELTIYVTQP